MLDFKIRLYPALDSIKSAKLKFTVTRSRKRSKAIQTRLDLNGLAPFGDVNIGVGFRAPGRSTLKWDHKSSNKLYLSKKTVTSVTKSKYYPQGRFPSIKYSNQFINNMFYSNARKVDFLWEQFGPKLIFLAVAEKENSYYFQNTVPGNNNKIPAEKLTGVGGRRTSTGKLACYLDLRYPVKKTVRIGLTTKQLIDSIEQDNYAPAMLLTGRLTLAARADFTGTVSKLSASLMAGQKWNTEKALRLALVQFARGAKLGNNECLVEGMRSSQQFQQYGDSGKGIRLLDNAAKAGHIKAQQHCSNEF